MKGCGHLAMSALLCLVAAGPLPGHGGAPESVDGLVTASDAIVVGTVAQGTVSGTTVAVSIHVERVLKGSWATGAVLAATGTLSEPSQTRAVGHAHGIFFLAKDGSGPMRLVPPMGGFLLDEMFVFLPLPDASVPAAQPAVNSSPRERVLLEVLGGMEAGRPKGPGGFVDVLAEYHAAPTPAIRAVLQSWLASGPPALTASAVQALLAEGDANTLSRVATEIGIPRRAHARYPSSASKLVSQRPASTHRQRRTGIARRGRCEHAVPRRHRPGLAGQRTRGARLQWPEMVFQESRPTGGVPVGSVGKR